MILGDILTRNSRFFAEHPAVLFEGRTISHRDLALRASRLANGLHALGVRRQQRVAMLAQNCPEYIELYGAAGMSGFIAVGLNYRLSAAEQRQILLDCEPTAWVFEAQYADRVREVCAGLAVVPKLVVIGEAEGATAYETLLASVPAAPLAQAAQAGDTAFLIYTSGTTGKPKGVMLGHQGQLAQTRLATAVCAATPVDRMLIVMPFYHVGALMLYLAYAWCGATIVLHRAFDAAVILDSLSRDRVSAVLLAPVMIAAILEVEGEKHLPDLHSIYYSSAPMPVPLLRRGIETFGRVFAQLYGMTENLLGTFMYKHQHVLEGPPEIVERLASAGQPYFGCEVVVRGADGAPCATGEVGEVVIQSPCLMQGYWNNPAATREVLCDGWYRTGDMGRIDDAGFLYLVDRKKDMIISGGENIYSREVEEALLCHPAVAEAAVVGIPDPRWGESVMAFVVKRKGHDVTAQALIAHCRERIASYKKPREVRFLDALPRLTSTQKIDKKALRASAVPG